MTGNYLEILQHLLAALLAGGLIGLERTYHGRPAGFRTHTLVCMASSLLMLLSMYQADLLPHVPREILRIDPTRMGQGIMTGIGFLGAGVIMKEGISVRGLTTAASIWMTAAIGILFGVGFFFAASVATVLTLVTLSLFRWIEAAVPSLSYARLAVRGTRDAYLSQDMLENIIANCGLTRSNVTYGLASQGRQFEYQMTLRARADSDFRRLADKLAATSEILTFSISPTDEK